MAGEMHSLIMTYGYWMVAFGAVIEGETFLVAAGVAASHGLLHLPGVILMAVAFSFLHDCAFFFLGRFYGKRLLKRYPKYQPKVDRGFKLIERYGVWIVVSFRYAYGLRMIIPAVLGMTSLTVFTFCTFALLGCVLWSFTFVLAGYFLGALIEELVSRVGLYEQLMGEIILATIGVILLSGFIWWLVKLYFGRRQSKLRVKRGPSSK